MRSISSIGPGDPARIARRDLLDAACRAVLVLEAMQHDVELQHADRADDRRRARRLGARRVEHLRRALFRELAQPGVELLSLHRIGEDDAREVLRREARDAAELEIARRSTACRRCAACRGPSRR